MPVSPKTDTQPAAYPNYLLKEILEQPGVINASLKNRLDQETKKICFPELADLATPHFIRVIACGTSAHAGLWASHLFENWSEIPCFVEIACESRYRPISYLQSELILAISQSGESADTLKAVEQAKDAGKTVLAIVNTDDCSLAQLADRIIITPAGPELAIPATKSLMAQMMCLLLLSAYLAQRKDVLSTVTTETLFEELPLLSADISHNLPSLRSTAKALALKYRKFRHFFFTGRGINYPLALEGALKFKEITYIHAEGSSLGAIPHGARALLDESVPIFALATSDMHLSRTLDDLRALKAQSGKIITLTNPGQTPVSDDVWNIPTMYGPLSSFLVLPALQLFAYEVGIALNRTVDTPRTLLKAVVEKTG